MSWFKKKPIFNIMSRKREAPDGLWTKCDGCGEILYARELQRNLHVCDKCGHHFRIGCRDYLDVLIDENSFGELFAEVVSVASVGSSAASSSPS